MAYHSVRTWKHTTISHGKKTGPHHRFFSYQQFSFIVRRINHLYPTCAVTSLQSITSHRSLPKASHNMTLSAVEDDQQDVKMEKSWEILLSLLLCRCMRLYCYKVHVYVKNGALLRRNMEIHFEPGQEQVMATGRSPA